MRTAGFSYPNPMEAKREYRSPSAGAKEIRVARADVACKQQTNLVGIGLSLQTAYQRHLIQLNATKLAPLRRSLDILKARTEAVIAKS
jgi:hypothetical protein